MCLSGCCHGIHDSAHKWSAENPKSSCIILPCTATTGAVCCFAAAFFGTLTVCGNVTKKTGGCIEDYSGPLAQGSLDSTQCCCALAITALCCTSPDQLQDRTKVQTPSKPENDEMGR